MRAKVKASKAGVICQGPGSFLIRNKTNTASIFLEMGAVPEAGLGEITPLATEAEGAEWEKGAGTLEVKLGPQVALTGIVKSGEGEQEIHVLRNGPHF
jgi:hypothetical protein